jgi:adenine phosphoribosyltransferase
VDAISNSTKILLVDEWIETGAQIKAAIKLIEQQGGIIIGIAAINIDHNAHTQPLLEKYNCQSLISNL